MTNTVYFDRLEHYRRNVGPVSEFGDLEETTPTIRNIGWTLGNDCPYRCTHCYSMNAREKGRDLEVWMIDRIVSQLVNVGVETVNLGGNEPLFTNGIDPRKSLLPYIIESLVNAKIRVGLTTSGITLLWLYRNRPDVVGMLNDCDVSFDSPFEEEHNRNRGAAIYSQAVESLQICENEGIPHTCILAAMKWNFTSRHIDALLTLAVTHNAHVRINPLKPVLPEHMEIALPPEMYYAGFRQLLQACDPIDLGEPPLAAAAQYQAPKRCPCGRTSFRIHSITPDGRVPVSPCVYLHDYKSDMDLLQTDLAEIVQSPQFKVFRQRNRNPDRIDGCAGCDLLTSCGGGCAGRSYLYNFHETGVRSFTSRDPYCPKEYATEIADFPVASAVSPSQRLVHMDYLCTWIGRPIDSRRV
jgi:radical SAM protein with 4Fe4S-binding SPASM domain